MATKLKYDFQFNLGVLNNDSIAECMYVHECDMNHTYFCGKYMYV